MPVIGPGHRRAAKPWPRASLGRADLFGMPGRGPDQPNARTDPDCQPPDHVFGFALAPSNRTVTQSAKARKAEEPGKTGVLRRRVLRLNALGPTPVRGRGFGVGAAPRRAVRPGLRW